MGLRWQSRRTRAHLLFWKQQNYDQLLINHQKTVWKIPKKILHTKRHKGGHVKTEAGAPTRYKQSHTCQVGSPQTGKSTSQKLTHRSESCKPHVRFPRLGVWHWDEEPREHLVLRASGACAQELHRTGGNRDSTLERCIHAFTCTGSQAKVETPQEARSDLPEDLGPSTGKTGGDGGL